MDVEFRDTLFCPLKASWGGYITSNFKVARNSMKQVESRTYSSTLKMEAACSSRTSVDCQWTTQRYTAEDITLHNHCCENLKSCTNTSMQDYA
jgi:hypothetical protein